MNDTIINIVKELVEDDTIDIDENTPLIGENSLLDSMNIVNLCIR